MSKTILLVIALMAFSVTVYFVTINKSGLPGQQSAIDEPEQVGTTIVREDGWAVVPRSVDGDREYWFVAPDIEGASPAVFKKRIHMQGSEKQTTIVSECEAPKATCERLMQQFEQISKNYD